MFPDLAEFPATYYAPMSAFRRVALKQSDPNEKHPHVSARGRQYFVIQSENPMSITTATDNAISIVPFDFEGAPVRTLTRAGDPWFVLADVCKVLGVANSRNAAARLDDDEKGVHTADTLGGAQEVVTINESGLYSLILTSRKKSAKRFKKWVTAEVLPAIRKTGGYMMAAPDETPEELAIRAMTVLQATIDRQKAQLAIAAPKAEALDLISTADGSLNLTEAAKALQMGVKALIAYLSANGWIYRRAGGKNWLGYQTRTGSAYLTHKVRTIRQPDGSDKIVEQVQITPRGLTKLAQMFAAGPVGHA
jgi:anti-repressor protein